MARVQVYVYTGSWEGGETIQHEAVDRETVPDWVHHQIEVEDMRKVSTTAVNGFTQTWSRKWVDVTL